MDERPLIGIVVVNYRDAKRTLRCVERLTDLTWPKRRLRVVVVDNSSDPMLANELRGRFADAELIDAKANVGFGGANNLAFDHLRGCDFIALLNNDALPDRGWLEPLVDALQRHPRAGAATPKVLLDGHFAVVALDAPTSTPGGGDNRTLGVQLCGARVAGNDVSDELELVDGFWGWEVDPVTVGGRFAWTTSHAVVHVPSAHPAPVELRLASGTGDKRVSASFPDTDCVEFTAAPVPRWFDVGTPQAVHDVINNTGSVLLSGGRAADRGYGDVDNGQYDEEDEVFGWSGAAVLLRRAYVDDVGGFDHRFFLYYEDTDLSWRGRLNGWTYRYVPRSVVRHEHSATTGGHRRMVEHLSDRNRLLMLTKCAPWRLATGAVAELAARLAATVFRDVLWRAATLRRPVTMHTAALVRVLGGYLRLVPGALRDRRHVRRGRFTHGVDVLTTAG